MLKEEFDRVLQVGDFVAFSGGSFSGFQFGIVISESEVFIYKRYIDIGRPLKVASTVLKIEVDDYNRELYNQTVSNYQNYAVKKAKSFASMDNLVIGDVFENINEKNDYAIYLGVVNFIYKGTYNIIKYKYHCYIKLSEKECANNGFMTSIMNQSASIKLKGMMSQNSKVKTYIVANNNTSDFKLMKHKSKRYTNKIGHINFIDLKPSMMFNIYNVFGEQDLTMEFLSLEKK
jgi:hypothetical protein